MFNRTVKPTVESQAEQDRRRKDSLLTSGQRQAELHDALESLLVAVYRAEKNWAFEDRWQL